MEQRYLISFVKRALAFTALIPFVWFCFIALAGLLIGEKYRNNLLYPYGGYGFLHQRFMEADTVNNIDVLIIGSSRAYRGIDPRFFKQQNISAFNLGSSLQTPIQSDYLLRQYVAQMGPEVVIYEVTSKTFSSDGVEGAVDVVSNTPTFNGNLLRMVWKTKDIAVWNSLAYSFFDKVILNRNDPGVPVENELDRYVDGGFVERVDADYIGLEEFDSRNLPIRQRQKESFESSLAFLKEENIDVILVQAPVLHDYYTSVTNQRAFDEYFSQHKTRGYFNFSDSSYNTRDYFYDHQHLNKAGVNRFNEALLRKIMPHLSRVASKDVAGNVYSVGMQDLRKSEE